MIKRLEIQQKTLHVRILTTNKPRDKFILISFNINVKFPSGRSLASVPATKLRKLTYPGINKGKFVTKLNKF